MSIILRILQFYAGISFLVMFVSAWFAIWYETNGIWWLICQGVLVIQPFWWLIEIIRFGDIISIFGVANLFCFIQNIVLIGVMAFVGKRCDKAQ